MSEIDALRKALDNAVLPPTWEVFDMEFDPPEKLPEWWDSNKATEWLRSPGIRTQWIHGQAHSKVMVFSLASGTIKPSHNFGNTFLHVCREDAELIVGAVNNLAKLLDIAEAMAAREPVDWYGERACLYCRVNIGDGDDHDPNCPKLLADELCGKEQDGAE